MKWEKKHGGLIRAARAKRNEDSEAARSAKQASGARYDQFVSHPRGMSAWIQEIANKLPNDRIRMSRKITSLVPILGPRNTGSMQESHKSDEEKVVDSTPSAERIRWIVTSQSSSDSNTPAIEETVFDAVILACPAKPAATLVEPISPVMGQALSTIQYADSAVVAMMINRDEIDPKLVCFGLVIPQVEGRDSLAISFTSEKISWPNASR